MISGPQDNEFVANYCVVVNAMYGYATILPRNMGKPGCFLVSGEDAAHWAPAPEIYKPLKPCCNCGAPKLVSLCEYCRT